MNTQEGQMADDSKTEFEIIVNGRPRRWTKDTITYEQVVELAFPNQPPDPNRIYTVSFKRGVDQGLLAPGQSTTVKAGMKFDVAATTRS